MTWEPVKNLLNIKEMLRSFDCEADEKERQKDQVQRKFDNLRKRSRKLQLKGSFEKANKIKEVIGLRRNKYDNQFMCKISWKAEIDTSSSELQERENSVAEPVIIEKEGTQKDLNAQTF